ncbi:hypothetical protein J2128_001399 [Methanomicrobium sp. W14]|uniref:phospholipase D-like domain-containing protein n=1 Tax=Methanomicrobium sp. W14 TaxID=2817839 RepID=UPI001AE98CCA|nr:phospholipase D-like domain-containing protein [Methanomicrobium sp. W14]MBP2133445.1 hypothetical protein [Methanomicrobium sp. W14]
MAGVHQKLILVLVIAVLLFFLVSSAYAFKITSVCPDTWQKGEGDEYFVISGNGSLDGFMVSDGEGSVRFVSGDFCKGSVTVAREGRAYEAVHGAPPDYEIYDTDPSVPGVVRSGNFRMGNSGDGLTLFEDNRPVQEVAWPGDFKSREGMVHVLKDDVWDVRPYYIGQSDFGPVTFENVSLTAFVSPDCSYEVISDAIEKAESDIKFNVYEFTSPEIEGLLEKKAGMGVLVKGLLEGGPVGGISGEEYCLASKLSGAGGMLYTVETEKGVFHTPYRYDHAKYLISDDRNVLLTSENFGETGFPLKGKSGNRGYGVYIRDINFTSYFGDVFETDTSGGWVTPFFGKEKYPEEELEKSFSPLFEPENFTGVSVTPVLSPDTSYLIQDMIEKAQTSVDIEQAYIKNWSSGKNPYLEAAVSAADRGVRVRILLDSYYYNTEDDNDNDEMADYINSVAEERNLNLSAALIDLNALGVEKIHNKAVITDGDNVLISSVNWNENSPSYNREAGVILSGGSVGKYYQDVFDYDWSRRQGTGSAGIIESVSKDGGYMLKFFIALFVIILFAAVYLVKRR